MPTFDPLSGDQVDAITALLPEGLDVRRVVVKNTEVSLFDADGLECVLIQKTTHPGGGLDVQFADHVRLEREEAPDAK